MWIRRSFSLALLLLMLLAPAVGATSALAASSAGTATGVVNINTGTAAELAWLPGIGPSRAERIVAHRAKRPFKKVVELARVKGIGLKTVRKLKAFLTVSGPTTATGRIAMPRDE